MSGTQHGNSTASGIDPRLYIRHTVADHNTLRNIDIQLFRGTQDHTGCRFPAIASHGIFRNNTFRMMITILNTIEFFPEFCKEFIQSFLDSKKLF